MWWHRFTELCVIDFSLIGKCRNKDDLPQNISTLSTRPLNYSLSSLPGVFTFKASVTVMGKWDRPTFFSIAPLKVNFEKNISSDVSNSNISYINFMRISKWWRLPNFKTDRACFSVNFHYKLHYHKYQWIQIIFTNEESNVAITEPYSCTET